MNCKDSGAVGAVKQLVHHCECVLCFVAFVDYPRHQHCIEQTIRNSTAYSSAHFGPQLPVCFIAHQPCLASGYQLITGIAPAGPGRPDSP